MISLLNLLNADPIVGEIYKRVRLGIEQIVYVYRVGEDHVFFEMDERAYATPIIVFKTNYTLK